MEQFGIQRNVTLANQKMNMRLVAISSGTSTHLIKLHLTEGQVVEHHMTNSWNINPFSKSRSCYKNLKSTFSKQRFNACSFKTR